MNLLAVTTLRSRVHSAWLVAALLALALVTPTRMVRAQATLSHTEDAAPIPRGMLRLRVINAWSRYDQRYCESASRCELGSEFSTDRFGADQLPRLTPLEMGLQTVTSDAAVRLSLGRLAVRSDARVVITPLALEYGVSRRLSVGVMVPVVQTRRTLQVDVNRDAAKPANVGLVPRGSRGTAAAQNLATSSAYSRAATDLAALIARCQSAPAGAGCAPVTANPAGAAAALTQARAYAAAVASFGTDTSRAILAPLNTSVIADSIAANRLRLNARLEQYLGAGTAPAQSMFFAASEFSYVDLQGRNGVRGLLGSTLGGGYDSLATTERLGIGDVEVGAQFLVFDRFGRDSLPAGGLQSRLMLGAAARLPTGRPDTASSLSDIGTGRGAGAELRTALDLVRGRVGGTIAARYVKSFARTVRAPLYGDPEAPFPYPVFGDRSRTLGDVIGLDVTPRYQLTSWLAVNGHYGLERTGATTYDDAPAFADPECDDCLAPLTAAVSESNTAQRLGLGIRYSTVDSYLRGRAAYPVEITFTHLETVAGAAGTPRIAREQIQLRLFYRLFGRR